MAPHNFAFVKLIVSELLPSKFNPNYELSETSSTNSTLASVQLTAETNQSKLITMIHYPSLRMDLLTSYVKSCKLKEKGRDTFFCMFDFAV
jgi:hypothetical protein